MRGTVRYYIQYKNRNGYFQSGLFDLNELIKIMAKNDSLFFSSFF